LDGNFVEIKPTRPEFMIILEGTDSEETVHGIKAFARAGNVTSKTS